MSARKYRENPPATGTRRDYYKPVPGDQRNGGGSVGNISALMLILIFLVIGTTLVVLFLAVVRETLFWYWRSKGVIQESEDILTRPHETAFIIRKNIAGLKSGEAASAKSSPPVPAPAAQPSEPEAMG